MHNGDRRKERTSQKLVLSEERGSLRGKDSQVTNKSREGCTE